MKRGMSHRDGTLRRVTRNERPLSCIGNPSEQRVTLNAIHNKRTAKRRVVQWIERPALDRLREGL